MYITTHVSISATIATSVVILTQKLYPNNIALWITGGLIGLGLAFLSHFPLDTPGEHQYKTKKQMWLCQTPTLTTFILLTIYLAFSGHILFALIFILGALAGMFPDLRDHAIPLIKGELEPINRKFSCHFGGEQFLTIKNKKTGKTWHWGRVKWNLTKTQTIAVQYISISILLIFTILIR